MVFVTKATPIHSMPYKEIETHNICVIGYFRFISHEQLSTDSLRGRHTDTHTHTHTHTHKHTHTQTHTQTLCRCFKDILIHTYHSHIHVTHTVHNACPQLLSSQLVYYINVQRNYYHHYCVYVPQGHTIVSIWFLPYYLYYELLVFTNSNFNTNVSRNARILTNYICILIKVQTIDIHRDWKQSSLWILSLFC